MAVPPSGNVLLFVAVDPDLRGRLSSFPTPVGMFGRMFFPMSWRFAAPEPWPPDDPDDSPMVPVDQLRCIYLLDDVVRKTGHKVRVVDVNYPEEDRPLVDQWVGSDDVLPVLVRSDGARLVGEEEFTPDTLRRFLGHY